MSTRRFTPAELEAIEKAKRAQTALTQAIASYVAAGFGSQVTDPLREALRQVTHSLREVQS